MTSRVPFQSSTSADNASVQSTVTGGGKGRNIGEEFLAYGIQPQSQFSPLVAICKFDGTNSFRDLTREDIGRITDNNPVPGGWIFRRGGVAGSSGSSSWVRRFGVLRNEFMFFFHNPHTDKPISLLPLRSCKLLVPPNGDNSFETTRQGYNSSQGFEFELQHSERDNVRLYALSESERLQWEKSCETRTSYNQTRFGPNGNEEDVAYAARSASWNGHNIVITNIKLSGDLLEDAVNDTSSNSKISNLVNGGNNSPLGMKGGDAGGLLDGDSRSKGRPDNNWDDESVASSNSVSSTFSDRFQQSLSAAGTGKRGSRSDTKNPTTAPANTLGKLSVNAEIEINFKGRGQWIQGTIASINIDGTYNITLENGSRESNVSTMFIRLPPVIDFQHDHENKVAEEGRARLELARERRRNSSAIAKNQEGQNPMTLSEMFRYLLFFSDEELTEDPLPDAPLQIPHLRGEYAEHMLISVYQSYCNPSGFMSLEEFVDFIEDSGVLNTHAPHDENDEPLPEFRMQLDPVKMLTSIPRNLGYTSEMLAAIRSTMTTTHDDTLQRVNEPDDYFLINFTQFYQAVLRISQICYPDLYSKDMALAMHKIMQECICPLYAWCQEHIKSGSSDVLVREERIALLCISYAPNLWKLFLLYARDIVSRGLPHIIMNSYPEPAMFSEKTMFGVPEGTPYKVPASQFNKSDSLILTEAECIRLCFDFGLIPVLLSKQHAKQLFNSLNRVKKNTHKVNNVGNNMANVKMTASNKSKSVTRESSIHFGSTGEMARIPTGSTPINTLHSNIFTTNSKATGSGNISSSSSVNSDRATHAALPPPGLSFSEFIEFLCRLGVEGLARGEYATLFPTPISKVMALFTLWGLVDLKKLENVRALNSLHAENLFAK